MARKTLVIILMTVLAGCVTKGERLQRELIEAGAPHPSDIIEDLAANDNAINTFRINGVQFLLSSPELADRIVRGRATIAFGRPDRLYISAREPRSGTQVLRVATAGGEALVYVFTQSERRTEFWRKGESIEGLPINVAPTDIIKEVFLQEDWDDIPKREVRLVDFQPETETATLDIGPGDEPRRRIEAHRVTGGHWVVTGSVYLEDGAVVADTKLSEYRDYGGIRFPTHIVAEFPQSEASIDMRLSANQSPNFNEELNNEWFDFTDYTNETP